MTKMAKWISWMGLVALTSLLCIGLSSDSSLATMEKETLVAIFNNTAPRPPAPPSDPPKEPETPLPTVQPPPPLEPVSPVQVPQLPSPLPTSPQTTPRPTPPLPTTPTLNDRALPFESDDPADQIAPPGLIVRRGNEPISPVLSDRMQKEMDNLVGRVESAMILANTTDQPTEISIASSPGTSNKLNEAQTAETTLHPALLEARRLSQDWEALMANQSYGEARDRWLAVRQNLWENFPLDQPLSQPEIRAMWLDRGTIVKARSAAGLAKVFDAMQAAGINTVFLETVNAGYPIYPTRVASSQNPLTTQWDPLKTAIALAHERNMALHAWMWVFAVGNQRHNSILNQPTHYLGPVLSAHPDWAGLTNTGEPIPLGQTKPFLDPANPEVRDYLLKLVDEIITNYDVDGLQLDYIRYPFQDPAAQRTYGYGTAARQQFRRLTGVDPMTLTPVVDPWSPRAEQERMRSLWNQWNQFRIDQVNRFVQETAQHVRAKRPDIVLSAAVFALPEYERLQKIQQDWNTWAENGWVDWIVLMSYAADTNRFSELITPWVVEQQYAHTLIIPGLRLLNMPVPVMLDQLQALRDLPAPGYALFATDNLDGRIQTVLNNTQGMHQGAAPQAALYPLAASRFQRLQQEWNWLLSQGQMILQPRLAARWAEDINTIGNNLAALAASPNAANSAAVRSQISALKQTLGAGVRLETATSADYRFRAWRNRLEAINRFLTYAENKGS